MYRAKVVCVHMHTFCNCISYQDNEHGLKPLIHSSPPPNPKTWTYTLNPKALQCPKPRFPSKPKPSKKGGRGELGFRGSPGLRVSPECIYDKVSGCLAPHAKPNPKPLTPPTPGSSSTKRLAPTMFKPQLWRGVGLSRVWGLGFRVWGLGFGV